VDHRALLAECERTLLDRHSEGSDRVSPVGCAGAFELAGESFGRQRAGASDDDLPSHLLVRAGDRGQDRALPGPRLSLDDHQLAVGAAELERRALLAGKTTASGSQPGVELVHLAVDHLPGDPLDSAVCKPRPECDGILLGRPVLAGGVGLVCQLEQLTLGA
jgi:hypothetical protein